MDAPGSRIGLRPGGQGRGGRLRRGVPGHGRLPDSGPLDDPGLVPISGPGSRSRTPAASGSSWPGFPPPALSAVTGDRFRRQDDGPRAACTCGRRCQRHGNPEDPAGGTYKGHYCQEGVQTWPGDFARRRAGLTVLLDLPRSCRGLLAARRGSSWSARSRAAARTNELEAGKRRRIIASGEDRCSCWF
jgi:hypothetical protein